MARSSRSTPRRRAVAVLAVGATLASGSALLSPATSSASSHREAPFVSNDPTIDNTDVYAFRSPDKQDTVSFIASWSPFQEPAGGPTFYPWATDAAYDINIDNIGDAKPHLTYRWTFKDVDTRGTVDHGDKTDHKAPDGSTIKGNGIGGTFLYNDGPVKSFADPTLRFKQTYNLDVLTYNADGTVKSTTSQLKNIGVPANNVGRASVPDFVKLRQEAVAAGQIPAAAGGGQSYVGQTDDAFFLDLRVFDLLYGTDLKEVGFDTLTRYNVNTIALQLPRSEVAAGQNVSANPVIGIWSTTSRSSTRTLAKTGAAPTQAESTSPATYDSQVSRLGNPLVNEVVVPANLKDYFNRSTPDQDAALLGKVTNPELPYLLELVYGIPNPNKVPGHASRSDLVSVFLTGLAGLNSLDMNAVVKATGKPASPAEYLRLNLETPVSAKPNRLGAVGGDLQGFPNGRRLADDVTDEALQVTEGVLFGGPKATPAEAKQAKTAATLGDGVNANDKPFMSSFPYIADPFSGSDPRVGQLPVKFRQSFTSTGDGRVSANVTNVTPAQPGSFAQLFRINNDGTVMGLGQFNLNAAGTGLARPFTTGRFGTNSKVILYFRIFANRYGSAGFNGGVPTTLTVR